MNKVFSNSVKLFFGSAVLASCIYGAQSANVSKAMQDLKEKQKKERQDLREKQEKEREELGDKEGTPKPKKEKQTKNKEKDEEKKEKEKFDHAGKKSGVIFGLSVGVGIDTTVVPSDVIKAVNSGSTSSGGHQTFVGPEIGVKLGYQYYFTRMLGLRLYADYGFSRLMSVSSLGDLGSLASNLNASATGNRIDGNMDVLFDILPFHFFSMGLIVGAFGGYNHVSTDTLNLEYSGPQFGINAGIQTTFASKHRLELLGEIGLSGIKSKVVGNATGELRQYGVSLGYSYVF